MQLLQILCARFETLGDLEDIKNAIRCSRLVLVLVEDDQEAKMGLLKVLGNIYRIRFRREGRIRDVDKAIDCYAQAHALMCASTGREVQSSVFQALGDSYLARFGCTGELSDMSKAINSYDQAVLLVPHNSPDRSDMLTNRGNIYLDRFKRFGTLEDIETAIDCHRQAMLLTADDHPSRPAWLSNLGSSHLARFEYNGEVSDVEKTIEYQSRAVLLTPDNHANKPIWLSNLGDSYLTRFKKLGNISDLDKAIEYQNQTVLLTPQDHATKPTELVHLGSYYMRRFQRCGELADVDKAIEYQSQAASLIPDSQSEKPAWLDNLGSSYLGRHDHRGELVDVEKAIHCRHQALLLTPDGHADKPARLQSLGNSYRARFEYSGEAADVVQAIHYNEQAVLLAPDGHSGKPGLLSHLALSYQAQFDHSGKVEDIDKAIDYLSQAMLLIPDNPAHLTNLGLAHGDRFRRLGELVDIDKCIQYQYQSLSLTPKDAVDRAAGLNNLGYSYASRYERLGGLADINKAIDYQTEAVLLTSDSHADKPRWLKSLGVSYLNRNKRIKRLEDVNNAVCCFSRAEQLTPDGHANKPSNLSNLGSAYMERFFHIGEVADAVKAIDCHLRAVLLTPDSHADKPLWLCNLGVAYLYKFCSSGAIADIDKAIDYQSQATALMPNDHAGMLKLLHNLGTAYQIRFKHFREAADFLTSNMILAHATHLAVGDPETRFKAACSWARSSSVLGIPSHPAYQKIMDIIPELIWLGSTIDQRYEHLIQIGDIAMEAAASAISDQSFGQALEWLEQGRSIVWNQILRLRSPFDDLSKADPVLAERLKAAGRALEQASLRSTAWATSLTEPSDLEQVTQDHHRLAGEWNELIETARLLPGFDDFMRPRKANDLSHAAKDGPVVVINVYSRRCDALIILPNSEHVAHVPLENFSREKATEARAQLRSEIGHRDVRDGGFKRFKPALKPENSFEAMLVILWIDVVKPILDFLEYNRKLPVDQLPHITWCTTGALSFLPLHAAGFYDGLQPNAFDLVISSYTPTLSALLTPSLPRTQLHSGILAVGQESTQGLGSLPNTVPELAVIKEYARVTRYMQLDGENATVEAVLDAMDAYSWVHLACHASQNAIDPAQSAFHLHDGDLLLSDITKRSFQNKGLAFLSACQTATGDESLPDEAVHLAAGMLMAGYPSVIATMWGINDEDAPEVARQVYAELLENGEMDHTRASRALHKAVAGLREKVGERAFQRWVPFVHIGS